jgi:hypothetical protein
VSPPRILSTKPDLRGIDVAASQVLLWPCHMFTVALPKRQVRTLNLFEHTVLRLARAGCNDAGRIAELICLDQHTVSAILRRLVGLRYLDQGLRFLRDPDEAASPSENGWESARVFVELLGGRLLPHLYYDTPAYAECLRDDGSRFQGERGPIEARVLRWDAEQRMRTPSAREVHAVARIQARRSGGRSATADVAASTAGQAISVLDSPDLVYLATNAVLQAGNHEHILLADPFGHGACGTLAEVFHLARGNDEAVRKVAASLLGEARIGGRAAQTGRANVRASTGRWPQVARHYGQAAKALQEASRAVASSEDARHAARATGACLRKLYDALEHTLHGLVREYPPGPGLRALLAGQPAPANGAQLLVYATQLGLHAGPLQQRLLLVHPGKFRGELQVELAPLLALNLAVACAERDGGHPLRLLAESHPDWLGFLTRLKAIRDSVAHGGTVEAMQSDALAAYLAEVGAMIELMLPGGTGTGAPQASAVDGTPERWRHQARLQARLDANTALAPSALDRLPERLAKACIELELVFDAAGGEHGQAALTAADGAAVVGALASMLQMAFEECLALLPPAPRLALDVDLRALARERAARAGFDLAGGQLPPALGRVNPGRLGAALRGQSVSLQWRLPALARLAGELAALRGHGYLEHDIARTELVRLRTQTYDSIPYLTET